MTRLSIDPRLPHASSVEELKTALALILRDITNQVNNLAEGTSAILLVGDGFSAILQPGQKGVLGEGRLVEIDIKPGSFPNSINRNSCNWWSGRSCVRSGRRASSSRA